MTRGYLIEAWDAGDNSIFVSSRLPQASVQELRDALGEDLQAP